MRKKRVNIDCDQDDAGENIFGDPSTAAVLTAAAAATATILTLSGENKNEEDESEKSVKEFLNLVFVYAVNRI